MARKTFVHCGCHSAKCMLMLGNHCLLSAGLFASLTRCQEKPRIQINKAIDLRWSEVRRRGVAWRVRLWRIPYLAWYAGGTDWNGWNGKKN